MPLERVPLREERVADWAPEDHGVGGRGRVELGRGHHARGGGRGGAAAEEDVGVRLCVVLHARLHVPETLPAVSENGEVVLIGSNQNFN